ncbi:MAG: TonB-dependent receptor [Prevotella sp.]|nr:TonB-dependent receptor [Prevotella sp.]
MKKILMSLCLAAFATVALAQNTAIKGTVVDEKGEPVIGASVTVVGQPGSGVITDLDGNYSIQAPQNAKLQVTYIGYQPMTIKGGGRVQLKEDTQKLEEVVVVGYGSQKKAHLTGSVATVPVEEIQDISAGGLASTLDGLVNGLSVNGGDSRPGENATIYIRDTNSLSDVGSTAQQPLFVIDGYIYPNDVKEGNTMHNLGAEAFNNLDPSVIENISVLKDASAAVYGARAANGVIIVTTKKGKLGAPKISYSGTFGFTDEIARPKMLSAYNYGRLYNAIKTADPTNTSLLNNPETLRTTLFQADELEAMKSLNYDLLDQNWSTAFTTQHAVNVTGATEMVNYFAGGSYFMQDGNLGKLDYDRWNYRAGVDVKLSKHLSANLSVSGDYGKKNTPLVKVGGSSNEKDYNLQLTRPYYIPEYVNGMPVVAYGPTNVQSDKNQLYHVSTLQNNGDYSRSMTQNTSINAGINYDFDWFEPLKGLSLRLNYSKSINTNKGNQYGSEYTVYQMIQRAGSGQHLYSPVNSGIAWDDLINAANFNSISVANGDPSFLSRSMVRTDNYQINFTASYARDFGKHHIGGVFTIEKSETESEYVYARRSEPYPFTTGQWNSASGALTNGDAQFTRAESGTLSYVGRINYAYNNRYLFEALLRSDASTKFSPENYWGTFPSFSAGWIMSEEDWFGKALPWIDFLKIRASWGMTGRDNTTAWQWMQVYAQDGYRGPIFGTGVSNTSLPRITINKNNSAVNRDAHWDKSYKTNVGIDLNVLKSRLGVTFDYYIEKNRDMLMKIAQDVPSTVGTPSANLNLGEMDSWGWELSLNWKDKIGSDFKYRIGINTGYRDNKVRVMDFNTKDYTAIQLNGRTDTGVWGMQCLGMFRSFQDIEEYFDTYLKDEKGAYGTYMGMTKDQVRPGMLIYKDVRGEQQSDGSWAGPNKKVSYDEDRVRLSDRGNPYGFSMNLGAEYKSFSLSAQLKASWGGYSFLPTEAIKASDIETTNMPSFWNPDNMYVYQDIYDGSGNLLLKENRNASMPNLAYSSVNSVQSSFWRVSGTRITLSRVTLAYTLPKNWVKSVGLSNVRFNITGQNLLSLYNPYPDNFIDPMMTYGSYPELRKFTIGVSVGF